MDNKKILSKLVKIASNQQAILNKLAQSAAAGTVSSDAAGNALNDFVKYQFTAWAMPKEIAGRLTRTIDGDPNSKHYNVNVVLTLSDPSQKSLAEDPTNGFASWLDKKFTTAPNVEKWKDLAGCTATFNVTTN